MSPNQYLASLWSLDWVQPVQPCTRTQGKRNLWEINLKLISFRVYPMLSIFMFDKYENFLSGQKPLTLKTKRRILPYQSHRSSSSATKEHAMNVNTAPGNTQVTSIRSLKVSVQTHSNTIPWNVCTFLGFNL